MTYLATVRVRKIYLFNDHFQLKVRQHVLRWCEEMN